VAVMKRRAFQDMGKAVHLRLPVYGIVAAFSPRLLARQRRPSLDLSSGLPGSKAVPNAQGHTGPAGIVSDRLRHFHAEP
jgi:hypothetical protein